MSPTRMHAHSRSFPQGTIRICDSRAPAQRMSPNYILRPALRRLHLPSRPDTRCRTGLTVILLVADGTPCPPLKDLDHTTMRHSKIPQISARAAAAAPRRRVFVDASARMDCGHGRACCFRMDEVMCESRSPS